MLKCTDAKRESGQKDKKIMLKFQNALAKWYNDDDEMLKEYLQW